MDNLGDWIYIVFLIVAAVSGLFSSKNKKKRPTQVLGQPEYEPAKEEHAPSGKGFLEIQEEATTPPPTPFLAAEQEIHKSKVNSSPITNFPTEEEHALLEDIEFNNAEELRKAVIYSEILNRKY